MPVTAYQGHAADSASKIASTTPNEVAPADRPGGLERDDFYDLASLEASGVAVTAVTRGPDGNEITVAFVDPAGNTQALSVAVTGTDIVVSLETDGTGELISTAAEVADAIDGDEDASALVSAVATSPETVVAVLAETNLSGGDVEFPGVPAFSAGYPRHDRSTQ